MPKARPSAADSSASCLTVCRRLADACLNFSVPRTANLVLFDSQLGEGPDKGRGPSTNLVQGAKRLDELQALAVGHAGWETATGDDSQNFPPG